MARYSKKKVLICPLDWGLGHATRCIPIIEELIRQGAEVIIAADNQPLILLKQEFPQLRFVRMDGYAIRYPERLPMALSMCLQAPKLFYKIYREHRQLEQLIRQYEIDAVISDNRYGLWSRDIYTVFITHQVNIQVPGRLKFLAPVLYKINRWLIEKYNECWIPDYEASGNLSGKLSHGAPLPANICYIGPLSRFKKAPQAVYAYDVIALVSGPEPRRSVFLKRLVGQLRESALKSLVVAGTPSLKYDYMETDTLRIVSHLDKIQLESAISGSAIVICRAGYSSIMDLMALEKKAILIPTPGQTEQEYLASHLTEQGLFYAVREKDFRLKQALNQATGFSAPTKQSEESLLKPALQRLFENQMVLMIMA